MAFHEVHEPILASLENQPFSLDYFSAEDLREKQYAGTTDLLTVLGDICFPIGKCRSFRCLSITKMGFTSRFQLVCGHRGLERPALGSPTEGNV